MFIFDTFSLSTLEIAKAASDKVQHAPAESTTKRHESVTSPKIVEIDAKLETNVVLLLCDKLLNLPIELKDIIAKLEKVR